MARPERIFSRSLFAGLLLVAVAGPAAAGEAIETTDTSPFCHYLDRGLDDFVPGKTDRYAVSLPEVQTLADIDHLQFGIDLPYSHCKADSHTLPCTDKGNTLDWCIGRTALLVNGLKLFDESAPSGCLAKVESGLSGIFDFPRERLRGNPQWGFTSAELEKLFGLVTLGHDGSIGFEVPGLRFSAEYLSRYLEGVVGTMLASGDKGCANSLYCGNGRGQRLFWTENSKTDCDLGGCPPQSERKSSPWVELKGSGKRIQVDMDLDLRKGVLNAGDCTKEGFDLNLHCGTRYPERLRGSVEFNLDFPCERSAARFTADGKTWSLPFCSGEPTAKRCFEEKKGAIVTGGTVRCPKDDKSPLCSRSFSLQQTLYDQNIRVTDIKFDSEGGVLHNLGEAACLLLGPLPYVAGCNMDNLATERIQGQIDTSLLDMNLRHGLAGCPAIEVSSKGDLEIDFAHLDPCPAGSKDLSCKQRGPLKQRSMAAASFSSRPIGDREASRVEAEPRQLPVRTFAKLAAGQDPQAASGKIPMAKLDEVASFLCGAAQSCSPQTDLDRLPLQQLLTIDSAKIQKLLQMNQISELQKELGFLIGNDEFKKSCVGYKYPAAIQGSPIEYLQGVAAWVTKDFAPAFQSPSCRDQNVEASIPALAVELLLETRDHGVSDSFPFLNLSDRQKAGSRYRNSFHCAYVTEKSLPPAKGPKCDSYGKITFGPDGSIKQDCGTLTGGPCAYLDAPYYAKRWLGGQDPESPVAHPNGNFAWNGRCDYDQDTGLPMSCVEGYYPGAGQNRVGTCKVCGEPPFGKDPDLYTSIGCRPENHICPEGTELAPDGRCWDSQHGRPSWECEANCVDLYNGNGFCVNGESWWNWAGLHFPEAADLHPTYAKPICADRTCLDSGLKCAVDGKACFNDKCSQECNSNPDCQDKAHYPEGFQCFWKGDGPRTCRLNP